MPKRPDFADEQQWRDHLRLWFAGQALVGYSSLADNRTCPVDIAAKGADAIQKWRDDLLVLDAAWCYKMADAMLAASERKERA